MYAAKISLSAEEMVLMKNSAWILTKNGLLDKMNEGLGHLANRMQRHFIEKAELLPMEIRSGTAKISRGEKYNGLPYLILDFPRLFSKEQILAIRTMFWWGNYCSSTLHVRGKYIEPVWRRMTSSMEEYQGLYVSNKDDEWDHDLRGGNYRLIHDAKSLPEAYALQANNSFLKLSCLTELGQWNEMEEELFTSFQKLLKLMEGLTTDPMKEVF